MASRVALYGIKNCDTVKKARGWLAAHDIEYDFYDFKVENPSAERLAAWEKVVGWEVLLNRAGTTFRALAESEKTGLNEKKALGLMVKLPSMIKRPVLVIGGRVHVGFKPDRYAAIFP